MGYLDIELPLQVLDEGQIHNLAVTYRELRRASDQMRPMDPQQEVLIAASRVLFKNIEPLCVGQVIIAADNYNTVKN